MHATPQRAKNDKSEEPMLSRLEKLRTDREEPEYQPDMPPFDAGGHLIAYFWEVGPTMSGGMGPSAVTHIEIAAWSMLVGIVLQPWEARLLRQLSRSFVSELHRAEKIDCPAPWEPVDQTPDHIGVANSMRNAMRKLANL